MVAVEHGTFLSTWGMFVHWQEGGQKGIKRKSQDMEEEEDDEPEDEVK